jgi:hypothetical protein
MKPAEQIRMVEKPIKYVAKVYKMGDEKMVVTVPKKMWSKVGRLIDKDVLVTLEEIDTS